MARGLRFQPRVSVRYQIKLLDTDLTGLVHEIATQVMSRIVVAARGRLRDLKLYPLIFSAAKEFLKARVHAYHVCGCARHCSEAVTPTELARPGYAQAPLEQVDPRSPRVRRLVIDLDVPLPEFVAELETRILEAIGGALPGPPLPVATLIHGAVEPVLGKVLFNSEGCNDGNFLCELRECTEYDPWHEVHPVEGHP